MRAAIFLGAMLLAGPAFAAADSEADAAFCRQWAADTMEVGQILLPTADTAGETRYKRQALISLCLTRPPSSEASKASDGVGYEVLVDPPKPAAKPPAKKSAAKKPKPAWVKDCEKYVSWRASDQTVITLKSNPARIKCPAKPKD
jgi:hypothetical protein